MEQAIPDELREALEAEEADRLGEIIRQQKDEHFEALQRIVESGPEEFRTKAIYALGHWGDPNAVPTITRILPELEEAGRIAAMDALARLATPDALDAARRFASDPSEQVRKFVIKALARSGSQTARRQLNAMARNDPAEWLRELAAQERRRR